MQIDDPSTAGAGVADPESATAAAEEHEPSSTPAADPEVPEADALEQSEAVPFDDDDRR